MPERRSGGFRTDSPSCHQPPSHQEQVAECEQREELRAVLGQPPVAGLHVAELALDHPKWMLDLRPDHRDDAVDPRVDRVQVSAFRGLAHDIPDLARSGEREASRSALT